MEATCPSPSLPDPGLARAIQARALGWAQVQMWEKVKRGAERLKLSPVEFKTVSAHPLTGGIKLRPHRDMEAPLTALGGGFLQGLLTVFCGVANCSLEGVLKICGGFYID